MKKNENKIIIYQAPSGAIEFRGDIKSETIWATQAQIAEVFNVERSVITKHIRNILKDKELERSSVCAKFAHTASDGKTYQVEHYNLDVVLSVGYRTNSKIAIAFRQWVTKTLREHITKGYTINRKQIAKNYDSFMQTVASIQNLLPENITLDPKVVLELIKEFASTWISLDAYDKELLQIKGVTKKSIKLTGGELLSAISNLKNELIKKGETTDLFATERQKGSVEGIVGNVMQTFGGKPLYETAEEKAAHLLYFMVKNHPFIDGNKRSGAFTFIWFIRKTRIKGFKNINPATLTTLTLLIAESDPKDKEQMVALVTQLLK
ncbi:MAG: virulence protein RhuM/Fic/DOC family protein [Candidatus Paceibacterota bacterium]|jgi:prophage maintenance system killer protein